MIVYGRKRTKYVLGGYPQESSYNGSIYSVERNQDKLIKIYDPEYREPDEESRVLAAIREGRNLGDGIPTDAVYLQGQWVGYAFDRAAEFIEPTPTPVPEPQPVPVKPPMDNGGLMALICVISGLVLSALIYFVLFDMITANMEAVYIQYNLRGFPMIIFGWVFMMPVFFRTCRRGNSTAALVVGILAFVVGAVVAFGFIWLVVSLVRVSAPLFTALLPTIFVIIIVIVLLKSLFRRR